MAGNRKNRRTGKAKPSSVERLRRAAYDKHQQILKAQHQLNLLRNALPLGHPENADKIALTMDAYLRFVDDVERGETPTVRGFPVIWDPVGDGEWLPAAQAFIGLHSILSLLGKTRNWGEVPEAFGQFGSKVHHGVVLTDADTSSIRAALVWMAAHVSEVTPNEWSEAVEAVAAFVEEQAGAQAA